jgi:hypothetical protein
MSHPQGAFGSVLRFTLYAAKSLSTAPQKFTLTSNGGKVKAINKATSPPSCPVLVQAAPGGYSQSPLRDLVLGASRKQISHFDLSLG